MSAIRKSGKINPNTTLIDIGMFGIYGITAVYLIQGEKSCLIDAGTRANAPHLVKTLTEMGAFPPDQIILTHPHWDHTQGIPFLQQAATKKGKQIEILASREAIPLLADRSFNDCFKHGPYESIQGVTPLQEGEAIDLGGITLRFYEIPGHCPGHIAILDEKNGNIFVGDAIGNKLGDQLFCPPFMPPAWDADAFISSVDKLKQIPYETLCLAHFGCIYGSEARSILDEAVETCRLWWEMYERHAEKLNDTGYLLQTMRKEINPVIPEIVPTTWGLRRLLGLITGLGSVIGKRTAWIDKLTLGDSVGWLALGYKMYKSS